MQQDTSVRRFGVPVLAASGLFVGLSVLGQLAAVGNQPFGDDTLEWLSNYEQALALAKETGRPLLVEFRCSP